MPCACVTRRTRVSDVPTPSVWTSAVDTANASTECASVIKVLAEHNAILKCHCAVRCAGPVVPRKARATRAIPPRPCVNVNPAGSAKTASPRLDVRCPHVPITDSAARRNASAQTVIAAKDAKKSTVREVVENMDSATPLSTDAYAILVGLVLSARNITKTYVYYNARSDAYSGRARACSLTGLTCNKRIL